MAAASDQDEFWPGEVEHFLPDTRGALEEAMGYVCCPICKVISDVPFDYFAHLPKRWAEEPALRAAVCGAGGFCAEHTWRLNKLQSQVAIARIYVDILAAVAEPTAPVEPCPLCRLKALMEELLVVDFARWVEDPAAQEDYAELFGVCNPHLARLLELELTPAAQEALLAAQEAHRAELAENLQGFLDKDTVEDRWTRTEAEKRAPRRTLLKVAGNPEA